MNRLVVLEEPRVFPPRKLLLGIWAVTLLLALYGIIVSAAIGAAMYVWLVIGGVSFWQLWILRWVHVDADGIRYRNLFQQGRALRWVDITAYREEEVRLSKHPYVVLHISDQKSDEDKSATRMKLTNDQVGFETLRTIVREAVPRKA